MPTGVGFADSIVVWKPGAEVIKPYSVLRAQIPCSSLDLTFHTVLNAQSRSPNLSTERPNPEYAQVHAQRRTQANKDGSSR